MGLPLCLLLMVTAVVCKLPPGYEDTVYCPPNSCLQRKHPAEGMTGPRYIFEQCCDLKDGTACPAHYWGSKVGGERKLQLEGWGLVDVTGHPCSEGPPCGSRKQNESSEVSPRRPIAGLGSGPRNHQLPY